MEDNGHTAVLNLQDDGSYKLEWETPDGKPADGSPDVATLEKGALADVGKIQFAGVHVGDAVLGGSVALLIAEVISGFMPANIGGGKFNSAVLVKIIAALGAVKFGPRFIGKDASQAAGLILAFDAARQLIPIDTTIQRITGAVRGATGGDRRRRTPSDGGLWDGAGTPQLVNRGTNI